MKRCSRGTGHLSCPAKSLMGHLVLCLVDGLNVVTDPMMVNSQRRRSNSSSFITNDKCVSLFVIINRKSIRAKLQGELSSNDYLALTNDSYLAQDNVLMIRKPLINLEATNPKVRLIIPAQQLVGSEVCEFTFHTTVATGMKWLD
ncbi:hypothetical protein CDAR_265571 [Caerostris darwini]|uniref:Uncharacterized protein n=1 Tax=Caerostris darwini TaxID=1538125 RepID=A0AAV4VTS5_9ARAC|nr:hypothetical protein CDAR_265571 [Caerostris darwini]